MKRKTPRKPVVTGARGRPQNRETERALIRLDDLIPRDDAKGGRGLFGVRKADRRRGGQRQPAGARSGALTGRKRGRRRA